MRRLLVPALALTVLAPACAQQTDEQLVLQHLDQLQRQSHSFIYTEIVNDHQFVVRGQVADDFRRSGVLTVDGADVLEMIVSDDALAVRAVQPDVLQGLESLDDPAAAEALLDGRWVVDHTAAPPLFAPTTREGGIEIGIGPFHDAAYLFGYLRRAVQQGGVLSEHNPDSIQYQPLDDPFAEITETELSRDRGYRRFDVAAPSLPGRADRGTAEAVPHPAHFRKLSFFVRGRHLVRIVEEISLERREFRRAREGRDAAYYLELRDAVSRGYIQEPMRLRKLSYEVREIGHDMSITLPLEDATTGQLGLLFHPDGPSTFAVLGVEDAGGPTITSDMAAVTGGVTGSVTEGAREGG